MSVEEDIAQLRVSVSCAIGWCDATFFKPFVGGKSLIELDCCFKKVNNVLMLTILWTITRNIEGAEAGGVFTELVCPESTVILQKSDPVRVHVLKQIIATERL